MSKIGKKNIIVPKDSTVKSENGIITVTGPKGSKKLSINDKIFSVITNENNEFKIKPSIFRTSKIFNLKFDDGISTLGNNLNWAFLILVNISPIGSIKVIFFFPYQLDLVMPGIFPEEAISLNAILDIFNFL